MIHRPRRFVSPLLAATTLAVLCGTGLAGCDRQSDLELTVLFEDAKGVGPEAAVVYRGLAIGEVEEVGFDQGLVAVRVRVDGEHAAQVCGDASFRIDTKTQPSQLEMQRAPGECVAMAANSTVRGSDGTLDDLTRKGKALYAEQAEKMRRQGERFSRSLEEWSKSPEAEKMRALAEQLARDVEELARLTQEEFDKRWPEIERRVDELVQELRDDGLDEEADKLERELGQ